MRKGRVPVKQFLIPTLVISIVLITLSNCGSGNGDSCIVSTEVDLTQSQCLADTISMACSNWVCSFSSNVTFSEVFCTPTDCTTLKCGDVIYQGLLATSTTGFLGEEVFSSGSTSLFACNLTGPVPTPPPSPLPTPQ